MKFHLLTMKLNKNLHCKSPQGKVFIQPHQRSLSPRNVKAMNAINITKKTYSNKIKPF